MIFSVSNNDGIEWFLDFEPDSVTRTVKDLVRKLPKKSQGVPLPAWSLLLSQKQDFWNNHLAHVPITPNQEGAMEMRNEVPSSVGAQDKDTIGYHKSDLEDVELYCKNDWLEVDAVFRPRIDNHLAPSIFNEFDVGSTAESRIPIDEEQDKENTSHFPTTRAFRGPIKPLC